LYREILEQGKQRHMLKLNGIRISHYGLIWKSV